MEHDNFYSIDRLMEFGLGLGMAQQMVKVMNQTMTSMYVPGSAATIPLPVKETKPIYVSINNCVAGPFSETEFMTLVTKKEVTPDSLVWQPGMQDWKPVNQVPEILRLIALSPPPLPKTINQDTYEA
ncbi:MAG: DUF4339 domain-containing protein [Bacteroidales bacterium]|nr:DUF4339 domain-containing protein [Bacteroidales bacterium]MBD5387217.1 DUF4339 domain-containing protein [bacterium]MDE6255783.1 DUF4339 domain-containing protein [Muribaculaceae bacterium]